MKKIVTLGLILILTICMVGNVYASFSCNVNIQASKTQVTKNDEFAINVNVSNIQSERGVISFGGILEYDRDSLKLIKMEGQNGWETPSSGSAYNETKGKIAITRSGVGKNNETIFKITFKVKETSKQNFAVTLKDIMISDGSEPFKINNVSQSITVIPETQKTVSSPETDNKEVNTNKVANTNSKTNTNSSLSGNNKQSTDTKVSTNTTKKTADKTSAKTISLPKAGEFNYSYIFIVLVGFIVIAAGIFFLKIRRIDKEMKQ